MSPDDHDLDEEIRGHLEIEIQERVARGVDREAARLAAVKEFGNLTLTRESIRAVWRPHWIEWLDALARDVRFAVRSLWRVKGLAITVIATLALGIGANAAIFSVVRGVLLRPLVNRDEDRLIYIRQTAPSVGVENMTFSVPEFRELESRVHSVAAFGDFSTVDFALVGLLQEPRTVKAGVVNGSYFDVMGLRPIAGRLLTPDDDGTTAAPVAVLTYRFWAGALASDRSVVGKRVRLGPGAATIVGVLEPSVPYPADTEIIANVVTSPHHLGALMETQWTHRMTDLFGRLAPGATLESARAELTAAHDAIVREHPDAYPKRGPIQLEVTHLRDQIAAPARTILLVLLAAAGVVFIIACSNVANLILARSVRREGELAVRAALGAGAGALRRTLLAESLVLCGAGAAVGVLLAPPFVAMVSQFAARFSVRALEVTVDGSVLWVGAALAIAAAVLLAYVPRLPSPQNPAALGLATGDVRITPGTNRRLRLFATTQIAFSFVLLAGAGMLVTTLVNMQTANTGYDMRHVLAFDVPPAATGVSGRAVIDFFDQATQRVSALPGVDAAAGGIVVPWRDAGTFGPAITFAADGYTPADGEESPRARLRIVTPRFFDTLGIARIAGRDFTDGDVADGELVAIVNQALAQRLFPNGDALNRHLWWTDPYFGPKKIPRRIVGIVANVDDEHLEGRSELMVYHPLRQIGYGQRLFVRTSGDPYAVASSVVRVIHGIAPTQIVERVATLEDIRAQVLSPQRVNAFVFSGFASIALLIAVVGVAGVLAFSVSARTREFGIRLAVGSAPKHILARVLAEGTTIAAIGIAAGAIGGSALARVATRIVGQAQVPGMLPTVVAALLLVAAATLASLMPAARASRIDVLQALRSE